MIKKTYFIFLFILFSNIIISQNIFDLNNSEKYARFLFTHKDYNLAAEEYKRLINLAPDSLKYKLLLIKSLKLSNQNNLCLAEIKSQFGNREENYQNEIINTYLQILFYNDNYLELDSLLKNELQIKETEKKEYKLALLLLKNDLKSSKDYIEKQIIESSNLTNKLSKLILIYEQLKINKHKRPFVAASLSAIIPGSGKMYANDTKNGIGIFSIIALNSWQSYRGFKIEGIKSFYGWAFGTLATGFYFANIYGAKKSALRENTFQKTLLKEKIMNIICDF